MGDNFNPVTDNPDTGGYVPTPPSGNPSDPGLTTRVENGHVYSLQWNYNTFPPKQYWHDDGLEPRAAAGANRISTPSEMMNADTAAKRNIIDDYIARQNAISEANRTASTDYQTGSTLGKDLLTQLMTEARDPAAGPLGLSAYAEFGGGAQNIAAGTKGAGIANPHAQLLDTLLDRLTNNANAARPPDPSATTAPIDPNKAPALTPEQAAKAPNGANSFYGFSSPDEAAKMHDYFVAKGMIPAAARGGKISIPSMIPPMNIPSGGNTAFIHDVMGLAASKYKAAGGREEDFWNTLKKSSPVPATAQPVGAPTPMTAPVSSIPSGESVTPMTPAMPSGSQFKGMPTPGAFDAVRSEMNAGAPPQYRFEDGGLKMLADAGLDTPEKVQQALAHANGGSGGSGAPTTGDTGDPYDAAINNFGQSDLAKHAMRLATHGLEGYGSTATGDNGRAVGGFQIRTDAHPDISEADARDPWKSTEYMSNDYNLGAERVMRENPDLFKQDPAKAAAMVAYYAEHPTNMYDQNLYESLYKKLFPAMAGGGGMTIGGEKHFIVDTKGNKVAALTEDGKPERVDGIGGVEVTPLDPKRHAAYEARKRADGGLEFATGGSALFPNIPNSGVNLSNTGTNALPSAGGPSTDRATQVGGYFKPYQPAVDMQDAWKAYHPGQALPTSDARLPADATSPSSQTRVKGFAELLGGALSAGNTAVPPEFLQALNSGKAPAQLLSANTLQTLAPSQRTQYFALLQAMGLGTPEDNLEMIKQGRPDTMNSAQAGSTGGPVGP